MNLLQALAYFVEEALRNLLRGWRISSLAVATTALSLLIGGTLVLLGTNLSRAVERWRADAQVVIYLEEAISNDERAALYAALERSRVWTEVREVSPEDANTRFLERFPDLAQVTSDLERNPLPTSIELTSRGNREEVASAISELARRAGVAEVDDDGEWLENMEAAASVASLLGLTIGGILMIAAAISIASVVRLSTFVYRKEIAAMRLIGATEFFIRGPFVVEGLVQGLAGSIVALAGLLVGYHGLGSLELPWFARGALLDVFLTAGQAGGLLGLGGLAGLVGGLIPLREKTGVFG